MDKYNLIILGFIAAAFLLTLWWAFNAVRRIDNQKNFCASTLTSIAKLWRRAKFVPEDAKERESLYLYRDFLRKFDGSECEYPIIVKDGGVRCMTRKEYDNLYGEKPIHAVSILISLISLIIAAGAILVNIFVTKTIWMGCALAAILPVLQIILAFFVNRFNRDKNNYRDGIFMALKENSVAFLRITKPFIIVDAYPHRFGKGKKPLYATMGTIPEKQVIKTRDFIIRQKEAEAKIIMTNVDNEAEIQEIMDKTTRKPVAKKISDIAARERADAEKELADIPDEEDDFAEADDLTAIVKPTANQEPIEQPKPVEQPTANSKPANKNQRLTDEEKEALFDKFLNDTLTAEAERLIQKELMKEAAEAPVEVIEPLPEVVTEPEPEPIEEPAEDDFSLDAIGQALDAEIAKRSKKH